MGRPRRGWSAVVIAKLLVLVVRLSTCSADNQCSSNGAILELVVERAEISSSTVKVVVISTLPGLVSCAVVAEGASQPKDVDLRSTSSMRLVADPCAKVDLTVAGLQGTTPQDMYCYAESLAGEKLSSQEILATRLRIWPTSAPLVVISGVLARSFNATVSVKSGAALTENIQCGVVPQGAPHPWCDLTTTTTTTTTTIQNSTSTVVSNSSTSANSSGVWCGPTKGPVIFAPMVKADPSGLAAVTFGGLVAQKAYDVYCRALDTSLSLAMAEATFVTRADDQSGKVGGICALRKLAHVSVDTIQAGLTHLVVTLRLDQPGSAFCKALTAASGKPPLPTAQEIRSANVSASVVASSGGLTDLRIANLTEATLYEVFCVAGHGARDLPIDIERTRHRVSTLDLTPPTLQIIAKAVNQSAVRISINSTEPGVAFCIVKPLEASEANHAPAVTEIIAGGLLVEIEAAAEPAILILGGLKEAVMYTLYCVARDLSGNIDNSSSSVLVQTADVTLPKLKIIHVIPGEVSVDAVVAMDEPGVAYCKAFAPGAGSPEGAAIKAANFSGVVLGATSAANSSDAEGNQSSNRNFSVNEPSSEDVSSCVCSDGTGQTAVTAAGQSALQKPVRWLQGIVRIGGLQGLSDYEVLCYAQDEAGNDVGSKDINATLHPTRTTSSDEIQLQILSIVPGESGFNLTLTPPSGEVDADSSTVCAALPIGTPRLNVQQIQSLGREAIVDQGSGNHSLAIGGLVQDTSYTIVCIALGTGGHVALLEVTSSTLDVKAPLLHAHAGYTDKENVYIELESTEDGVVYCLPSFACMDSDCEPPTLAELTGSADTAKFEVFANTMENVTIPGVSEGMDYDVFCGAEDASGNIAEQKFPLFKCKIGEACVQASIVITLLVSSMTIELVPPPADGLMKWMEIAEPGFKWGLAVGAGVNDSDVTLTDVGESSSRLLLGYFLRRLQSDSMQASIGFEIIVNDTTLESAKGWLVDCVENPDARAALAASIANRLEEMNVSAPSLSVLSVKPPRVEKRVVSLIAEAGEQSQLARYIKMAFGFLMGPAVAFFGQDVRSTLIAASAMIANGVNGFVIKMQTADRMSPALLMDGIKLLLGSGGVAFAGISRPGAGSKLQAGSVFNSIASYIVPLARDPLLSIVGGCEGVDPENITLDWPAGVPLNCASDERMHKAGWAIKSLEMGIIGTGVKLADKMSFLLVIFNSASMGANMIVSAIKNLMIAQAPKEKKKKVAAMLDKFGVMMFGMVTMVCIKFQLKEMKKKPPPPIESKDGWVQVLTSGMTFNKISKGVVVAFEVQANKNAFICLGDPKDKEGRQLQVVLDFKNPEAEPSDPPTSELREIRKGKKEPVGDPVPGVQLDEDDKKKFRITFNPETTEFALEKPGMTGEFEPIIKKTLPEPKKEEEKKEEKPKKKFNPGAKIKEAKEKVAKMVPHDPKGLAKEKGLTIASKLPINKIPKVGPKLKEVITNKLEAAKKDKEQGEALDKLWFPKGCWVKTDAPGIWIVWPAEKVKVEDPNKPKPTGVKKYLALLVALPVMFCKIGMGPLLQMNALLQLAIQHPELMNADYAKKQAIKKAKKIKDNKDAYIAMAKEKMGKGGGSSKVGDMAAMKEQAEAAKAQAEAAKAEAEKKAEEAKAQGEAAKAQAEAAKDQADAVKAAADEAKDATEAATGETKDKEEGKNESGKTAADSGSPQKSGEKEEPPLLE